MKEAEDALDGESSPDYGGDGQPGKEPAKAEPAVIKQETKVVEPNQEEVTQEKAADERDKASPGDVAESAGGSDDPPKPWVPERVQKALIGATPSMSIERTETSGTSTCSQEREINLVNPKRGKPEQRGWRSMWSPWTARKMLR